MDFLCSKCWVSKLKCSKSCYFCTMQCDYDNHCRFCHQFPFCFRCGEICDGSCSLETAGFADQVMTLDTSEHGPMVQMLLKNFYDYDYNYKAVIYEIRVEDMLSDKVADNEWNRVPVPFKRFALMQWFLLSYEKFDMSLCLRLKDRFEKQLIQWVSRQVTGQAMPLSMQRVLDFFHTLCDTVSQVAVNANEMTMNFIGTILEALGKLVTSPVEFLTRKAGDAIIGMLAAKVQQALVRYVPMVVAVVKMMVRCAFGYTTSMLLFELLTDPVVSEYFLESINVVNAFLMSKVEGQGNASPMVFVVAMFVFVLSQVSGIKTGAMSGLLTSFKLAESMVPSDMESFVASIPVLGSLFYDDIDVIMRRDYPAHYAYIDAYPAMSMIENPKPWELRQARQRYADYMDEVEDLSLNAKSYFRSKVAFLKKPAWLSVPTPGMRVQPPVLFIQGEPGQGKTTAIMLILQALYKFCAELELIPPYVEFSEFYWTYFGLTKHFDGYCGQPVIFFNDFLAQKETPENSNASVFLGVVDTAPFVAPMADVGRKGTYVEPICCVATSNMPWEVWRTHLLASNNVSAYFRRVSRYYVLNAIEKDRGGNIKVNKKHMSDQYEFRLREKPGVSTDVIQDIYGVSEWLLSAVSESQNSYPPFSQLPEDLGQVVSRMVNRELIRYKPKTEAEGMVIDLEEINAQSQPLAKCRWLGSELVFSLMPVERKLRPSMFFAKHKNFKQHLYVTDLMSRLQGGSGQVFGSLDVKTFVQWVIVKGLDVFDVNEWRVFINRSDLDEFGWSVRMQDIDQVLENVKGTNLPLLPLAAVTLMFAGMLALAANRFTASEKDDNWKKLEDGVYELQSSEGLKNIKIGDKHFVKHHVVESGVSYPVYVIEDMTCPQNLSLKAIIRKQEMLKEKGSFDSFIYGKDCRDTEQEPALKRSVVQIMLEMNEDLLSHGFALSCQEILMAGHVADRVKNVLCIRVGDKMYRFQNVQGATQFVLHCDRSADLCYIRLLSSRLEGCRNHLEKFAPVMDAIEGLVVRFDRETCSEPVFMPAPTRILYDGTVRNLSRVVLEGAFGLCGKPFKRVSTSSSQRLVGIHVAGNMEGTSSHISHVTQKWILEARKSTGTGAPPADYGGVHGQCALPNKYGMQYEGKADNKIKMPRESSYEEISDLNVDRDDTWTSEYAIAKLAPGVVAGHIVYPERVAMRKWEVAIKRRPSVPLVCPADVVSDVVECMSLLEAGDDWLPTFQEAVKSDSLNCWQGVTRGKSAGPAFGSSSKWIFFDIYAEQPVLTELALTELKRLETNLMSTEGVPFRKSICLKDEKRLKTKVKNYQTRLFAPDDAIFYILCKKYFATVISKLAKFGPKLGIMCNMDPVQLGRWLAPYSTWQTLSADVQSQDFSHVFEAWIEFFQCMMAAKWFSNDHGARVSVHPDLPDLDPVNVVRFGLIREMALGYWQFSDELYCIPGALPSGCFLTFILNVFRAFMVWRLFLSKLARMLDFDMKSFMAAHGDQMTAILFGDDSQLLFNPRTIKSFKGIDLPKLYKDAALELGYVLTAPDKSPTLYMSKCGDDEFCGRRLYHHSIFGWVMRLVPNRLVKSVQFTKVGRFFEVFPGQVDTFLREAVFYEDHRLTSLVNGLKWDNGSQLTDYLPVKTDELGLYLKNKPDIFSMKIRESVVKWMISKSVQSETVVAQAGEAMVSEQTESEHSEETSAEGGSLAVAVQDAEVKSSESGDSDYMHQDSFLSDQYQIIFSRPYKVADINWISTDAVGINLYRQNYPSAYFNNNANAQMKLANTVGFRGTVKITVFINSTAFQAGKLLLYGSPMARQPQNIYEVISGPHAVLTAGSHTSAQLVVPFSREWLFSATGTYSGAAQEANFDFLQVGIMVLSPLSAPTMPTASLVVWASLEDCEVMQGGLTGYTIAPQAKGGVKKSNPNRTDNVVIRAADEATSTMDSISTSLASGLKTIGNAAQTAASIASTVAGVAMLIGLSKPTVPVNANVVTLGLGRYMANSDGTDMSQTMCLYQDGKTIPPPGLFSDSDDSMDVNHVSSRVGLLDVATWTATDAVDTFLFKSFVTPGNYKEIDLSTMPTPLTWISAMFQYWRGTMSYRFSLVKTSFHTGTLEIIVDFGFAGIEPSSDTRAGVLHRVLWDITLQDEIVIDVPYVYQTHFREFEFQEINTVGTFAPRIYLKNATFLGNTTSVGNFIEILVEHWSEDLQVAFPRLSIDTFEAPVPLSSKMRGKQSERVVGQMFRFKKEADKSSEGGFDPGSRNHDLRKRVLLGSRPTQGEAKILSARFLGSEYVPNLRLVGRRFGLTEILTTVAGVPFVVDMNDWNNYTRWIYTMSQLYVFGVGGFRLKTVNAEGNVYVSAGMSTTTATPFSSTDGFPQIIMGSANAIPVEITMPNMSRYPLYQLSNPARLSMAATVWPTSTSTAIYTAMADDCSFGGINFLPGYTRKVLTRADALPGQLPFA